jgi:hypothetical protein
MYLAIAVVADLSDAAPARGIRAVKMLEIQLAANSTNESRECSGPQPLHPLRQCSLLGEFGLFWQRAQAYA